MPQRAPDGQAVGQQAGRILEPDGGGHVGLDDTRPHFVDGDLELAQPRSPKLRGHAHARLGDAVVAAIDRGDGGRNRRDVDNAAAKDRVGLFLLDHPIRAGLRKEVGTAQIDRQHAIEAFFGRIQDIGPSFRRDACVIDQDVEVAEVGFDRLDEPLAGGGIGDVGLNIKDIGT